MVKYGLNCKCGRTWKRDEKPKEHEEILCPNCNEQYNSYWPMGRKKIESKPEPTPQPTVIPSKPKKSKKFRKKGDNK